MIMDWLRIIIDLLEFVSDKEVDEDSWISTQKSVEMEQQSLGTPSPWFRILPTGANYLFDSVIRWKMYRLQFNVIF